jgi:hypothetical protein
MLPLVESSLTGYSALAKVFPVSLIFLPEVSCALADPAGINFECVDQV